MEPKTRESLSPSERLVVAVDFEPNLRKGQGRIWARAQALKLAGELYGLPVTLKMNSLLRTAGYDLIDRIHRLGFKFFADLKLIETKKTIAIDGGFLRESSPEVVTAMCSAGIAALIELKATYPAAQVVGVTVPTSMTELDTKQIYDCEVTEAVRRLAVVAKHARLAGVVCAPAEVKMVRQICGADTDIYAAGIRLEGETVQGDDQNLLRVSTPYEAIRAGADYIIVGRPITQAKNPRSVVERIVGEIARAERVGALCL